jgi:hypothetical protein
MAPIAALLWFLTGWWITKVIIWAAVLFLPFAQTGAKTGRREGRFLDLAGRRLNNGKA